MFKFEELHVYQEAILFSDVLYTISKSFPRDEMFGLTNQLRRAAVSISLNIAEGSSRTKKDFCHFLDIARGSCYECVAILTICKNQKYISANEYTQLYEQCNKITKMLNGLKNSLL